MISWSHHDTIKGSQSVTRWLCEGLATSCSLPATIGKFRVTIVLPSFGENAWNRRGPHKVKTMATRTDRMYTWWSHDGHTVDEKDKRSQRDGATSGRPSAIFDMPKILFTLPKLLPNPKNSAGGQTMAMDAVPNDPIHSRSFPMLQISFIVCPSRAKIGTVWR